MPWRVGIDEAGYGPNLGPFVMSAVACRVPEQAVAADLWRMLRPAVRRAGGKNPRRLFVDDSKLIYSTARGVGDLETSVLSILRGAADHAPATVAELTQRLHPEHELGGEPWYGGATSLPLSTAAEIIAERADCFRDACAAADLSWSLLR